MPAKQRKKSCQPVVPAGPRFEIAGFLERHATFLVAALILFASIRIVATYTVFNHTSDEPAHIACGMEWLDQHVYTWETQHPPLARVAAALGPYLLGIRSQGTPRRGDLSMSLEGTAILYRGHHYDRTLAAARLGELPFFWAACLVVYGWGRRYFGPAVGIAALFLFSFVPTVLAHAGLATTDMALTAFLGAAFLGGADLDRAPTVARPRVRRVAPAWRRSPSSPAWCFCPRPWRRRWSGIWPWNAPGRDGWPARPGGASLLSLWPWRWALWPSGRATAFLSAKSISRRSGCPPRSYTAASRK